MTETITSETRGLMFHGSAVYKCPSHLISLVVSHNLSHERKKAWDILRRFICSIPSLEEKKIKK